MTTGRRALLLAPLAWAALLAPCQAGALWYNGDNDGRDALNSFTTIAYNNSGTIASYNSFVYDDFVVPTGQTWTLSSVFGKFQLYFNNGSYGATVLPSTATWQILQGVSTGNGGTVVAGGTTAAASSTLLNSSIGEYQVTATISPVTLTAGTYWLTVAPNDPGGYLGDYCGVETTSGANSIGAPAGNDGNSYITTTGLPMTNSGYRNFAPTSNDENAIGLTGPYDYSFGVNGTSFVVPEPSSLALTGLGLAGLAVRCRRRLLARSL